MSSYSCSYCFLLFAEGWIDYTPYICGNQNRVLIGRSKTAEECKQACDEGCIAVEWWETGSNSCFKCIDTSQKSQYNNQNDGSFPPHLFVKI